MFETLDETADFSSADLPPNHLMAIGQVCVQYAVLETLLINTIHNLASLQAPLGLALTVHMTTPVRLSAFQTLANLRLNNDDALLHEVNWIVDTFKIVSNKRAEIVHPMWAVDRKTGAVHRGLLSARKELKRSFDKHPVESIKLVIEEIRALIERLSSLHLVLLPMEHDLPKGFNVAQLRGFVAVQRKEIDRRYAAHLAAQKQAQENKMRKRARAEASRVNPYGKKGPI